MGKKELSYWEKRALEEEKRINNGAKKIEKTIVNAYKRAQEYLTIRAIKLFERAQNRSELSADEVKRILNEPIQTEELVILRKMAKDIHNPEIQELANRRLTALAFKERISRLEDLKAKAHLVINKITDIQLEKSTDYFIDTIHQSYQREQANVAIQQMAHKDVDLKTWNQNDWQNKASEFKQLTVKKTKNILESHWLGSNYSKRLWNDTDKLGKRLEELFTVEALTGMSEREMSNAIAKEFETSLGIARRLIRTEANYMANQAKLKAWEERGVEYYVLVAVLDLRTSSICQKKDQQVFLVSQAKCQGATGNYPPFHPWCRTVAAAYYGPEKGKKKKANDPIKNKSFEMNSFANYADWINKLKEFYSDEEIDRQKKMILNRARDNSSYKKMREILGKKHPNLPATLDEYQQLKYNNSEKWRQLQDNLYVKQRLLDGRWGSKINPEKQAPHMEASLKIGKSYFKEDIDIHDLFNKYAGTGWIERNRQGRSNKEIIFAKDFEGIVVNNGVEAKTHYFKIHYSAKRLHIVPYKGGI